MGRPNVNWNVGIAAEKQSTYTSKAVKAGIPFASQVTEPNTKYIIKYDFDLGGESVTIPEGCILEFDGGKLKNGGIVLNETPIFPNPINLRDCFINVSISGTPKTVVAESGITGIREDKFAKGQQFVAESIDSWKTAIKEFDGYQISENQTYCNTSTSPSGRANTISLCDNWVRYKANHPTAQEFVYGGGNTCFRKNFDENAQWEINCSTFALLVSLGIPFEYSRYYLGSSSENKFDGNHFANKEMMDWFMNNEYNSSRDLAVYLYNQGFCFKPNPDYSNIDTGDILFFDLDSTNNREGIDFLGIDHSGIFGYRIGDRYVTYEVGSGAPEQMQRASGTMKKIVLCARLPKKDQEISFQNLAYNSDFPKVLTGESPALTKLITCKTTEKLVKGNPYTAIVKCALSDNSWLSIMSGGSYLTNFTNVRTYRTSDNVYYMTFVPISDITSFDVCINATTEITASFTDVILLHGVHEDVNKIKGIEYPRKIEVEALDGVELSGLRIGYGKDVIVISGIISGVVLTESFTSCLKVTPLYLINSNSYGVCSNKYQGGQDVIGYCQVTKNVEYGVIRFYGSSVETDGITFSVAIPCR